MKICKNCTNPCEDVVKFCVHCGCNEFITDAPPDGASDDDIPKSDEPCQVGVGLALPESPESDTTDQTGQIPTGISAESDSDEPYDIIEIKKPTPVIAVRWPAWVKAAVFLMSASILFIVAFLIFSILSGDEAADLQEEPAIELIAVPTTLAGATDTSAQALLESLGFVVVVERVYSPTAPIGSVIGQNPRSGLLQRGDSVTLYVSLGRQSVIMPDLVGMTREESVVLLSRMNIGFSIHSEGEFSDLVAHDFVIRQFPPSGTELFESSQVDFFVSLGPPPEETPIALPRFAINYLANGGIGTMAHIHVEQGQAHTVLASQFTRSGYVFTGWNTLPDGGGASFLPGATLHATLGDINLFAQWQQTLVEETEPDEDAPIHVSVTHIDHVPTSGRVNVPLSLTGTVLPIGATTRFPINWSVISGGGVTISAGVLTVSQTGNVIVRATIPNGRAIGSDFTQDFTISIAGELPTIISPPSITGIYGFTGIVQLIFSGSPTSFALSGNVPIGVTITNTGVLAWSAATPVGVHNFSITAINQHGNSAAFSFVLVIEQPPS